MPSIENMDLPGTVTFHGVEEPPVVVDDEDECKVKRSGLLCAGFVFGRDGVEVEVEVMVGRGVEASVGGFDVGERFAHREEVGRVFFVGGGGIVM